MNLQHLEMSRHLPQCNLSLDRMRLWMSLSWFFYYSYSFSTSVPFKSHLLAFYRSVNLHPLYFTWLAYMRLSSSPWGDLLHRGNHQTRKRSIVLQGLSCFGYNSLPAPNSSVRHQSPLRASWALSQPPCICLLQQWWSSSRWHQNILGCSCTRCE